MDLEQGQTLLCKGKMSRMNDPGDHLIVQSSSRLMQLPIELRDQIYLKLFNSTRLIFGRLRRGHKHQLVEQPTSDGLGILRTCRQINDETNRLWLSRVELDFAHVEQLLNHLAPLSDETVSQIRYITVGLSSLCVRDLPYGYGTDFFTFAEALKLIESLQLDDLTIIGFSFYSIKTSLI